MKTIKIILIIILSVLSGCASMSPVLILKSDMKSEDLHQSIIENGGTDWTLACSYAGGRYYDLANGMQIAVLCNPGGNESCDITMNNSRMLRSFKMEKAYSVQRIEQWKDLRTSLTFIENQTAYVYKGMVQENAMKILSAKGIASKPVDSERIKKSIGALNKARMKLRPAPEKIETGEGWLQHHLGNQIDMFLRYNLQKNIDVIFCSFPIQILVEPEAKMLYETYENDETEYCVLEFELINIAKPCLNHWQGSPLGYKTSSLEND